jgi:hypothetical protein
MSGCLAEGPIFAFRLVLLATGSTSSSEEMKQALWDQLVIHQQHNHQQTLF